MIFLLLADLLSFVLLLVLVVSNYWLQDKVRSSVYSKYITSFAVIFNLLPLVLLKVFPELIGSTEPKSLSFNVLLPLGLAFYALQQITAIVDIYRENALRMSFVEYFFYSFFFVTVISGPIFRYKDAVIQFQRQLSPKVISYLTAKGLSLFVVGFAKLVLIATPISQYNDIFFKALLTFYNLQLTFTEAIYLVIGGILSIYFTFSAYSDMAIGLALCFGLRLPINFDSPLKAGSASAYINSWHISFVSFVRFYVFQPVFNIVKRFAINDVDMRLTLAWAFAVFASFFVTGAWHAPTAFMIGQSAVIAFFIVSIELLIRSRVALKVPVSITNAFSRILTMGVVLVTGLFFLSPNIEIAQSILSAIFSPKEVSLAQNLSNTLQIYVPHWFSFDGFFPNYNGFPDAWKTSFQFLTGGAAIIHLLLALMVALVAPNTMQIFNLHNSKYKSLIRLRWSISPLHAILISVLFFLSVISFDTQRVITYG